MRIRLSTIALTAIAGVAALNASYWKSKAGRWSEADVDAWFASTQAHLTTLEPEDAMFAAGEMQMLVCRRSEPPFEKAPWFWCVLGIQFDDDDPALFRPVHVASGWGATRIDANRALEEASAFLFEPDLPGIEDLADEDGEETLG